MRISLDALMRLRVRVRMCGVCVCVCVCGLMSQISRKANI